MYSGKPCGFVIDYQFVITCEGEGPWCSLGNISVTNISPTYGTIYIDSTYVYNKSLHSLRRVTYKPMSQDLDPQESSSLY